MSRLRLKIERATIDAVALAGWLIESIVKQMTEMAAAVGADDLGAVHAMAAIIDQLDGALGRHIIEAWPAAATGKLGAAGKQRRAAGRTSVQASVFIIEQMPGEGLLGGLFAQHLILLRRQLLPPVTFRLIFHNQIACPVEKPERSSL